MKPKHIFWGLFFVSIGVLILLSNLGALELDIAGFWKLWPLVFILWGIAFLINSKILKGFIAAATAIILALAVFAFFSSAFSLAGGNFNVNDNGIHIDFDDNTNYDTTLYAQPFDRSVNHAEFYFKAGAGRFVLNDTTADLFSANTRGIKDNYEFSTSSENNDAEINFKMRKHSFVFFKGNIKNFAEIKLNPMPVWDLNFELGASSTDLDLSSFKTEKLNLKTGASSITLKLGSLADSVDVNIDAGVSSIHIKIPDSTGCEIRTSTALSSRHMPDFDKYGSNLYRTSNFDSAVKKIFINIHSGLSSINVTRYGSDW